ncbi:MAG: type II secretion system GspH family protein [Acidobacteriia bacterium]|nr:type II secretion system GspH family protein [Terriglobia bacterium]
MKRESGFTLLEVLVALTIMAVGVALTLSLISGSLGNIRKVRAHTRLIDHAQAVMETALLDDRIQGATTLHGDFEDGTRWSVVVSEVEMPAPQTALPLNTQLQMLTPIMLSYVVDVMEPNSPKPDFQLQTLKLISPPPQPGQARVPQ